MIWYFTPYGIDKDLGKAYNQYAKLVTDKDDWICFLDADTCIGLVPKFGHVLQEIVDLYPDTGLFTSYASRIGNKQQRFAGKISEDPNILNHKKIAKSQVHHYKTRVKELNKIISGHLMMVKKSTWDAIGGAPEGIGILSIDNWISKRILRSGKNILLMEGIYLFHFYRLDTGKQDKSHLL